MAKRAVLVGAGSMGRTWAKALHAEPTVELAAWVDLDPETLESARHETGVDEGLQFTCLDNALDLGPDFVVDVTVPEAHREITVAALERGIPVLGEKPMATSMAEAREMVTASERAGTLYMVSQSRRYNAGLHALRGHVQELGQLGILNCDFYLGPHFGGFRDEMCSPLLLDMAIHTFDAARFLSMDDAVSVYAEEFNPDWSWYAGDACATALFEMTNGLRFAYRGSWCAEGFMTSWEGDWRAVGRVGTATWNGSDPPSIEIVEDRGSFMSRCRRETANVPEIAEGINGSLQEFLRALDSGQTPNGECHDNIKSLAMVFSAIESSRRGARMSVTEILTG